MVEDTLLGLLERYCILYENYCYKVVTRITLERT
jgi:hypothetical protein